MWFVVSLDLFIGEIIMLVCLATGNIHYMIYWNEFI